MLPVKDEHGSVEYLYIFNVALAGTFAFVVQDSFGHVIILVSGQFKTVRKIDILAVHKEIFVQQSGFIQRLLPDQHKSTGQHIYLVAGIGIEIRQTVLGKAWIFGKQPGQSEHFAERNPGCGKAALGFGQKNTVSIYHFNAQGTGLGFLVEEITQGTYTVFTNNGIGVKQQDIFSLSQTDGLVVGFGKAGVVAVFDKGNLGEIGFEVGHRSVGRVIVYHKDFGFHALQGGTKGIEALFQKIFYIVIYDYNR